VILPEQKIHVYEVRPRSDKRGFDLISDALALVGCGMPNRTQSAMQSTTLSFSPVSEEFLSDLPTRARHGMKKNCSPSHGSGALHPRHGRGASRASKDRALFHSDYYFSSSVSLFQIPNSFRDVAQRLVSSVDHGCYLSGLHKISQV